MNKTFYTLKLFLLLLLPGAIYILSTTACNVSTAHLSDVKVCSSLNKDGECDADSPTFPGMAPVIYCSAKLKNAPSGTKVTFSWKYGSEDMGKADVETGSGNINSSFKPSVTLEPGKYSV